jgi:hypothetical protein
MSIMSRLLRRKKKLTDFTVDEIRVEEKRLEIRENQHINQIEKYDTIREDIFHQGAKTKSPSRRRIYARRFNETCQRLQIIEKDLSRVVKELMTLSRVRAVMERKKSGKTENILQKLTEEDMVKLTTLLEDDKITEEVYLQKLDGVLGIVNDPAYETPDLGEAGSDVLKTWERMDEGDLEFDEGLREAAQSEGPGGQKEKEAGEADPAF